MIELYGIANCDKVKKARSWLEQRGLEHHFHDFRKDGLDRELVSRWYNALGDQLINRRSTTWRNLEDTEKSRAEQGEAIEVLLQNPTLIQRPVLKRDGELLLNFSADSYAKFFD